MDKQDRLNSYKFFQGLNAWEIGINEKDIKPICVNDGPMGVRKPSHNDFTNQEEILKATCMLSGAALASSFSEDICYRNGKSLAQECNYRKVDVLLAPGVNIKRSALCGRNFEYFSEDPYLAGLLASAYIRGLEENGAASCVKHFVANNQENNRMCSSSEMSLRALNEIYLYPFAYIIKHSNPSLLMTSYNRVNGVYINESKYLLQDKLRTEYQYKGLIISDWTAVVNKGRTIACGLDVEMPISKRTMEEIDEQYNIEFNEEDILNRRREIINSLKSINDKKIVSNTFDFNASHKNVVELAKETFVLLKNEERYLPFNKKDKVLVLGYFANNPRFVGGGSGYVNVNKGIDFISALNEQEYDYDFYQAYSPNRYLLDENLILNKINDYKKVIVFLGQYADDETEGRDRISIDMHIEQLKLIEFLNKNSIDYSAIIITGSVINIEKIKESAKAIIVSYLAGEGMYEALRDTIFGDNNPSGRLPETWISSLDANPIYDEISKNNIFHSYYDDDIYVGYRYYDMSDTKKINYYFGDGLSYAQYVYDVIKVALENNEIIIDMNIENVSDYDGKDVIQIYVGKRDSSLYRPLKELKAIKKCLIKKHEIISTTIHVSLDDLKVYDITDDKMKLEDGKYEIYINKDLKESICIKELYIKGEKLKSNLQKPQLIRHQESIDCPMMVPTYLVIETDNFKKMMQEANPNLDITKFFESHQWMLYEPVRNLTYNDELNIDFKLINKYYK